MQDSTMIKIHNLALFKWPIAAMCLFIVCSLSGCTSKDSGDEHAGESHVSDLIDKELLVIRLDSLQTDATTPGEAHAGDGHLSDHDSISQSLHYIYVRDLAGDTLLVRSAPCVINSAGERIEVGKTYRMRLSPVAWEHDVLSSAGINVEVQVDGRPFFTTEDVCDFYLQDPTN